MIPFVCPPPPADPARESVNWVCVNIYLQADSALFPGYCSLLFDMNQENNHDAFSGARISQFLWMLCSHLQDLFLFIFLCKEADPRTV